jgi:chitinase
VGTRTRGLVAALLGLLAAASAAGAQSVWVTGYYPGWRQSRLAPANIDFAAVTHLAHFSVVPRADGSLNASVNMLTPANVKAAVAAAHEAGKSILFTVGGQDTREAFEGAMDAEHRPAFVSALVAFMRDNGYDGIDVDMEDVTARDERDYARFIRELRARLDAFNPRPLLTAAALWRPALFAELAGEFDQINLMTYNLSGPYPGWVVWHSGSLFDGGHRFPNGKTPLPSADGLAEAFLAAGVPKAKLGVGISFNGYVWSGGEVNRPRQAWKTPPEIKNVPYYALAETYHIKEYDPNSPGYHWDDSAQAAYLSIDGKGPADAQFVSYDNEVTAGKMIRYVRSKGIGGLIVWDLGAGYRADQPEGRRDLLLRAVERARLGEKGDGL